ncbi:MAG: glycosyltransferase [Candidatus Hydrogenedentes bacterium]|nr:glycosyltransferase [Candidatus Hydrogenedentota bacterium]
MSIPPYRIAVLTGIYPAVSQTFITRDVVGLRKQGFEVWTCSLNKPKKEELLTALYRDECENTFYIKAQELSAIAIAHLGLLLRSPARYLSSLVGAIRSHEAGIRGLLWSVFYFVEAGILANWAERKGIKHLFVHFAQSGSAVAMIAARLGHLTFSVRPHGPDEFYDCEDLNLEEKFRAARAIVCISDFCRSQVLRLLPENHWSKVSIVRCGVDIASYSSRPARNEVESTTHFLCVARLACAKGLPVLLHACRRLADAGVDVDCTIVGDGPDKKSLYQLVERLDLRSRVCFVGAVGQDRIQDYYDRADVFVLPSFAEGVPVVLMEAMAKELPVISTRVMGIPELIDDGVNGLLVPPADNVALAMAMERLAGDADLRRTLGMAGRAKVATEYNIDLNTKKLALCLQEIANGDQSDVIATTALARELQIGK